MQCVLRRRVRCRAGAVSHLRGVQHAFARHFAAAHCPPALHPLQQRHGRARVALRNVEHVLVPAVQAEYRTAMSS
eukprot:2697248-Pleurochrysis_carterae.AAC.1